ncbi:MAG: cysteine hydrolase [Chloroflexi bacterium]|nr:cysteine hydrolase [Chloroflexota bacterium]
MSKGRIYTEMPEVIAPEHSMLIVWDVQNALVNRAFNKNEILRPISALLQAARKIQVPVVYTRITPLPPRFQPPAAVAGQMRRMGVKDVKLLRSLFGDDPSMKEIPEAIAPLPEDMVLNKNTPDIFIGTNLDYIARYGGIETLVFTGISTEVGIDTSVRHALALGYYAVVVSDAVSSPNKDAHDRSLANLNIFCPVVPHSEILKTWR